MPLRSRVLSTPFVLFLAMMLFVTLGDALMSYIAPVLIENALQGTTMMGIVLSTSSMAGALTDFTFARVFGNKSSVFFSKIMLGLVLLFPLLMLLNHSLPSFVLAMVIWGVYFEGMVFSNYHFIHEQFPAHHHARAWRMLTIVKSFSWFLGPLLASTTDTTSRLIPLYLAAGCFTIAVGLFLIRLRLFPKSRIRFGSQRHQVRSFAKELRIWKIFSQATWPLLGLWFLFFLIEGSFFSIGPIYAENLKELHPFGGLFITMFSLPTFIVGGFATQLAVPFGKKRAAFLAGILTGIGLIALGLSTSVPLVLTTTLIAAFGAAALYPELAAVFEDYMARSGYLSNDFVGLAAIIPSLGYVLGPLISGFLADHMPIRYVFGIYGVCILGYSILLLLFMKRKVRLPQQQLRAALRRL